MENISSVSKMILDYGFMAVFCAVFIVVIIFTVKWIRQLIDQMVSNENTLKDIRAGIENIAEGLRQETMIRIQQVLQLSFDLAVEQVCRIIKNVRKQNHIVDHPRTKEKVTNLVNNIHEDRKERFKYFTYKGKFLSEYFPENCVQEVVDIVISELYNEDGANNERAYNNVKMVYDNIKLKYYDNLNSL